MDAWVLEVRKAAWMERRFFSALARNMLGPKKV